MNRHCPVVRPLCGTILLCSLALQSLNATEADPADGGYTVVQQQSALDERITIERDTRFRKFVLTPHKPNYILPLTHNSKPNQAPFDPLVDGIVEETEFKFQLSIKFPIAEEIFGKNGTLYGAYTNLSFWQAYNADSSHPFRETNHEPELILGFANDWEIFGFENRLIFFGINHQSNGQSGSLSRSWNRLYAELIFQKDNFYLSLKPWIRIEPPDVRDDNPDILDYMGHGEIRGVYATNNHTVAVMLRNNFDSENRGAFELDWSFPMSRRAKWFIQYFNGYGESLIDYNASVNRIGIGFALTDWL